jgi:predicted nuclease with TOPRIM domain
MTTEERFERLENIMDHVVDRQERLDAVLETLAEAQVRSQEQYQETQGQFRAMIERIDRLSEELGRLGEEFDRYAKEGLAREKRLDERIDNLVSGIGEFMRRNQ